MKSRLVRSLIAGLCVTAGFAVAQETPDALVRRAVDGVTQVLKSDKDVRAGSRMRLNALVDDKVLPYVDVERMTRGAAGRHWADATPDQRQALTREFKALLTHTYAGVFASYRDDTMIEYRPAREPASEGAAEVRSLIRRGSQEPVQVDYTLEKIDGAWKVIDINVLGIRVVETYRSQFNGAINAGGFDGLIKMLATKNRDIESRARA